MAKLTPDQIRQRVERHLSTPKIAVGEHPTSLVYAQDIGTGEWIHVNLTRNAFNRAVDAIGEPDFDRRAYGGYRGSWRSTDDRKRALAEAAL